MVVFYDVLLLDDEPVIHQTYEERREHLERLIARITGKSEVVWRKNIDFSTADGPKMFIACLANAFVHRWEGLVLKPAHDPYFDPGHARMGRYETCWLKIKKDCMAGLGDTADFIVVGAGYDPKAASKFKLSNLSWTHFFIACLTNKTDVFERGAVPSLFIFDCLHGCIKSEDLVTVNQHGRFREIRPNSDEASGAFRLSFAKMDPSYPRMSVVFKQPFVFEIAGSGFDKPPNRTIFTLRFPRVTKIHWDRDWKHSVSLDELQTMARHALDVPSGQIFEEELAELREKLNQPLGLATREQAVQWDHTEDDKEPSWMKSCSDLAREARLTACKGRSHLIPLLTRVDTEELMPSEKRQEKSRVNHLLALAHASTNNQNDSSSHHPSTSFTQSGKRKPSIEHLDTRERDENQARKLTWNENKSEPLSSRNPSAAPPKWPLSEIDNSARPVRRDHLEIVNKSQRSSKEGLDLRRTMASGKGQLIRKKHRTKPRRFLKTHWSAVRTLKSTQIVLSPSLISSMPTLLSRLLEDFPTKPVSFQGDLGNIPDLNLASRLGTSFQMLYLVDASDTSDATASSLHQLANHLGDWYPSPVHIWDWRILDLTRCYGLEMMRINDDRTRDLRIAEMSWVPSSDQAGSAVSVHWSDGSTTTESSETFVELKCLQKK